MVRWTRVTKGFNISGNILGSPQILGLRYNEKCLLTYRWAPI